MDKPTKRDFIIRKAVPEDWDRISQISSEIAKEGLVGDYISNIGPKYLTIGQTLVIEYGDNIVGYHNVQEVSDISVYLSGLRITRNFRRRGLALYLINDSLTLSHNKGRITARAYIEPENTGSRALFEKAGFKQKEKVYLYFGSLDTELFEVESEWPNFVVDIGHVPSRYFQGIPAKVMRNGKCKVVQSEPSQWDGLPSFTVLSAEGCNFTEGNSFIVSRNVIDLDFNSSLRSVEGFHSAYLYEKDLV